MDDWKAQTIVKMSEILKQRKHEEPSDMLGIVAAHLKMIEEVTSKLPPNSKRGRQITNSKLYLFLMNYLFLTALIQCTNSNTVP